MSSASSTDSSDMPPAYQLRDESPPPGYEDHANGVLPPPPDYQLVEPVILAVPRRTRVVEPANFSPPQRAYIARVARIGMTHNVYINHFNSLYDNRAIDDALAEIETGHQPPPSKWCSRRCKFEIGISVVAVVVALMVVFGLLWAQDRD